MRRKENWFESLTAYIDSVMDKEFIWGEHDCCLFSAACVEAMTGHDYMAEERDTYDSQETAQEALKGRTLYMATKKKLGKPNPLATAQRGDVIYHVFPTGPALGICIGADALFVGREIKEGLVSVPVMDCSKSFRIPF